MNQKVGVVIVSYNASVAVRTTLASLRHAKNETPTRVLLIDNASVDMEREKIRLAFERHVKEAFLQWEYIQQDKNLGFPGGNNFGIRRLLEDPDISHICLLNSDVIVTDHWIDYLVEKRCDIISAVTNKAESEQCVPIDYSLELAKCLDERNESIPAGSLSRIQNFAQDWHEAWAGSLVEADVTFFCVLIAKPVFDKVGLLDEAFFPGGYEDNDFCLRARKLGYKVNLARDVFIHHWGGASFLQLQYDYFNGQALRNRSYLEKKHGITWHSCPEKVFVSYLMDLKFACSQRGNKVGQHRFNDLYTAHLGAALEHFESDFRKLRRLLENSNRKVTPALQDQIKQAAGFGDLADTWRHIVAKAMVIFSENSQPQVLVDDMVKHLEHVAAGIRAWVECNVAMHSLLNPPRKGLDPALAAETRTLGNTQPPNAGQNRLSKLWWILRRGIVFLCDLRGLVIFGGYPYPERQRDGYFQRIQIVDSLFTDRKRVYVESDELPGRNRWFDRPQHDVLVLRITGGPSCRALVRTLALIAVLKCRKVYFHSVLRMRDNRFGLLLYFPWLTRVIDLHGVVPEEFRFHNDFYSAVLYEREERLAVRKSDMVIVVTEAMQNYLRQKYREDLRGQVAILPMFPNIASNSAQRPYADGKPVVVYAGGLHKWQQVPKMVDAINRTVSICVHRFYCSDPDAVRAMLPEAVRAQVIVDSKAHEELIDLFAECHYGFVLRENIVVNHVACPTKLVEYLGMGIVPILDCEEIGDFKIMGMQFVTLNDLLQGNLPDEARRSKMARENFAIYERLREVCKQGAQDLYSLLAGDSLIHETRQTVLSLVKGLLPPDTRRGRLVRFFWRLLNGSLASTTASKLASVRCRQAIPTKNNVALPSDCDVLIQVSNFEAGGLENMVLDLSDTITTAGYKVVLLVLGMSGEGVKRAQERDMVVIVESPEVEQYRLLIKRLKPRAVIAHYSFYGADLCHEYGIPFFQVIHNTYMWFNDDQYATFGCAARFTTLFLAVSEYVKSYSVRRLGVDETCCIVIPNGIDSKIFDTVDTLEARQEIRTKHRLDDRDFVFLSVGSINHQKNHIATVRAFATVIKEMPRAKLVILGPAYEKRLLEEIECFVAERGIGDRVTYAGSAPGAHKYYAMADAFVSASFFEGGPLNQLEAIRAKLPCVMTDVGYAGYFKNIPGCEIVAPPLDIVTFNGTLLQLASTPAFEKRLGVAMVRIYQSRRRPNLAPDFLDAFDKSKTYQCYVDLIENLLQGNDVRNQSSPYSWPNQLTAALSEHASAAA